MSLEDKIKKAKPTSWVTEGIPKWKVRLIIKWARIKNNIYYAKIEKKHFGNFNKKTGIYAEYEEPKTVSMIDIDESEG